MNILTNVNTKEFKYMKINKTISDIKEYENKYKKGDINKLDLFKQKLKKFIFFNPIINIDGLINFQTYKNFTIKKSKVKNIINVNYNDYLILTDISLLYYNTNKNNIYNIEPKYSNQKISFGISEQSTKNDFDIIINFNIQNDEINTCIKDNYIDSDLDKKTFQKTKNFTKKISMDYNVKINKDNFSTLPKNKSFLKKTSSMLNSFAALSPIYNYNSNQNISSICKYVDNLILIAYKTIIIKCIFSKINNELLSVNVFNHFTAHKKPIYLINTLDNRYVVTASEDNTFKIWDITESKNDKKKVNCLYSINKRIFSIYEKILDNSSEKDKIENNYLFFGHKTGFFLCENFQWNNMKNITNHKDKVTSLLINRNNEVITGSLDRYIKKTDFLTLEENNKIIMENGITSFIDINENIFGVIIEEFGLYLIDSVKLCRINYIKNWDDKIKTFGNLGEGCFYCIADKENKNKSNIIKNIDNDNINLNNNILIRIVKGYFGNDERFAAFT
jgi:hypothetical protein